MNSSWIIQAFQPNGNVPYIYNIGVVTNTKDKDTALEKFPGAWAVPVQRLTWEK